MKTILLARQRFHQLSSQRLKIDLVSLQLPQQQLRRYQVVVPGAKTLITLYRRLPKRQLFGRRVRWRAPFANPCRHPTLAYNRRRVVHLGNCSRCCFFPHSHHPPSPEAVLFRLPSPTFSLCRPVSLCSSLQNSASLRAIRLRSLEAPCMYLKETCFQNRPPKMKKIPRSSRVQQRVSPEVRRQRQRPRPQDLRLIPHLTTTRSLERRLRSTLPVSLTV